MSSVIQNVVVQLKRERADLDKAIRKLEQASHNPNKKWTRAHRKKFLATMKAKRSK